MTNYKVREMLATVNGLGIDHTVAWSTLSSSRYHYGAAPEEQALRSAASALSHAFTDHLLKERRMDIRRTDEGEGVRLSFRTYALTREELLKLLGQAFDAGRMEAPRIMSPTLA